MTARRKQPTPRTGYSKLVRAAVEVSVYAGKLGFVPVTKRTATRLLRTKAVTFEFVAGLDLLLLAPATA